MDSEISPTTELYIADYRLVVEKALQKRFGEGVDALYKSPQFKGKLSVYPEKVDSDITSEILNVLCGDFSSELQRNLAAEGKKTDLCRSGKRSGHAYLLSNEPNMPQLYIDPSIGQYLASKYTP